MNASVSRATRELEQLTKLMHLMDDQKIDVLRCKYCSNLRYVFRFHGSMYCPICIAKYKAEQIKEKVLGLFNTAIRPSHRRLVTMYWQFCDLHTQLISQAKICSQPAWSWACKNDEAFVNEVHFVQASIAVKKCGMDPSIVPCNDWYEMRHFFSHWGKHPGVLDKANEEKDRKVGLIA